MWMDRLNGGPVDGEIERRSDVWMEWWAGLQLKLQLWNYKPAPSPLLSVSLLGGGNLCWIWAPAPSGLPFLAPGHTLCTLLQV